MNLPGARTGLCKACGKPTALLVHQGCGDSLADKRVTKKRAANARHARNNYQKGKVPPFARGGA